MLSAWIYGTPFDISVELKYHEGTVLLKNHDSLSGKIILENPYNFKNGIWINLKTQTKKRNSEHFIPIDSVNRIIIMVSDTSVVHGQHTVFYKSDKSLFRIIFDSDSLTISDRTRITNESPGFVSDFIRIHDKKNNRLYVLNGKKELTEFINRHFNKNFNVNDFKRKKDAIRYILKPY